MLSYSIQILLGFASGIAVGAGYVAFITMLKIIPRLIQLSKQLGNTTIYIYPVILGTLFGTYLSFTSIPFKLPVIILILVGIAHGVFNGMLAAALAEILNVFPILSRRIGIGAYVKYLIMAIVFGKVIGSLFQWLIFVKY